MMTFLKDSYGFFFFDMYPPTSFVFFFGLFWSGEYDAAVKKFGRSSTFSYTHNDFYWNIMT